MTTDLDPQSMDRDGLIAEVMSLRSHRDRLLQALKDLDSIGGAVVNTVLSLDSTLTTIEPLLTPRPEPEFVAADTEGAFYCVACRHDAHAPGTCGLLQCTCGAVQEAYRSHLRGEHADGSR